MKQLTGPGALCRWLLVAAERNFRCAPVPRTPYPVQRCRTVPHISVPVSPRTCVSRSAATGLGPGCGAVRTSLANYSRRLSTNLTQVLDVRCAVHAWYRVRPCASSHCVVLQSAGKPPYSTAVPGSPAAPAAPPLALARPGCSSRRAPAARTCRDLCTAVRHSMTHTCMCW